MSDGAVSPLATLLALHETSLQIEQHSFLSPASSQNIARKVHNISLVYR